MTWLVQFGLSWGNTKFVEFRVKVKNTLFRFTQGFNFFSRMNWRISPTSYADILWNRVFLQIIVCSIFLVWQMASGFVYVVSLSFCFKENSFVQSIAILSKEKWWPKSYTYFAISDFVVCSNQRWFFNTDRDFFELAFTSNSRNFIYVKFIDRRLCFHNEYFGKYKCFFY